MTIYTPLDTELKWAPAPGQTLQLELEDRGVTQADLAARTNLSPKHVNLVIKGHAPLSPEMAVALEGVLGGPAETWLRLEAAYRARAARNDWLAQLADYAPWLSNFPRKALVDYEVVGASDSDLTKVEKVLRFFQVASPEAFEKAWLRPQASYRRSQIFEINSYATALWLRLTERAAEHLDVAASYDPGMLRQMAGEIPGLTRLPIRDGFLQAQALLGRTGVALVFVEDVGDTRISGATRVAAGRPIIALTGRYQRFDSFWFTLLHEIGHLVLHPKRATFLEVGRASAQDDADAMETAADSFAAEAIVPRKRRKELLAATTEGAMRSLADDLGVSVGMVAGQRGALTNTWNGAIGRLRERGNLNQLLRPFSELVD